MENAIILMRFWPILICLMAGLIWLVRLESKVMYLKEHFNEHRNDKKTEAIAIFTKLNELEIILAEINGKLKYLQLEKKDHD